MCVCQRYTSVSKSTLSELELLLLPRLLSWLECAANMT